jgi:hypothetical protein
MSDIFSAISAQDVHARIARTRSNTAPGPDGLERKHVSTPDAKEMIRILFNLILTTSILPSAWDTNRTILIPKQGNDHGKINNFRPITISSILCRMYWGIIDMKLRKVFSFSPRQKGFIHETGCFTNIRMFNEILRSAKRRTGMTAVQLDIAKAFDTIPHSAIAAALERAGLPHGIKKFIVRSYANITTIIEHKGTRIEIPIRRGINQGDPLSPFLFNLTLDPLLEILEEMPGFRLGGAQNISALAFADDLLLLATGRDDAQALLRETNHYIQQMGMSLAVDKCASFTIVPSADSWYIVDPGLRLEDNQRIPYSSAESSMCYLGGNISPWSGLQCRDLITHMEGTLKRLRNAPLKPHQKLSLTTSHILPNFLHKIILTTPPITTIRSADQVVRTAIKTFLHLPMCTQNGFLYCGKRDGGLGIPKLELLSPCSSLRQGLTLLNSSDPAVRALHEETGLEQRLQALAKTIRLPWPVPHSREIEAYKRARKKEELKKWSSLPTKGRGVPSFTDDRYGNAWLYTPTLLKPSRFLTALRLRSGGVRGIGLQ